MARVNARFRGMDVMPCFIRSGVVGSSTRDCKVLDLIHEQKLPYRAVLEVLTNAKRR